VTYSRKELAHVPEPMATVRAMRRKYKLTQDELAAMIGVRRETLVKLETGKQAPRKGTRAKLAAFSKLWAEKI
jgi:DNA-binding XRE family transcriptional regulator